MNLSVEERAARWQRRNTGPWRTVQHGPVVYRYGYRPRIDVVHFNVAWHDLWTHVILRGTLVPLLLPVVRRLARWLA